ncbi:TPR repeat protein oca3 [Ceratocystis lukuohia]|uniref:ER membrane protein complex subunit 2 n=1 Tax=Ceratocystis lukuohia TaxID=2019550 RepID=A0ABR4MKJ2_9PEZI
MSPSLIWPQALLSPEETLQLAQQAPKFLASNPQTYSSSPLSALLGATESRETWITYENLLLACLQTGDDESAVQILERLVRRFGDDNERIMALEGLFKEAVAKTPAQLESILNDYVVILESSQGVSLNIPIAKRRIALARSMGRVSDAISYINELLKITPTDAEAWAELADMYLSQGLYGQAIYSFEEVLVLAPNAWNVYARLGEVLFMAATAKGSDETQAPRYIAESVKRFCRSIELCDDYLRGYYGLKTVTDYLIKTPIVTKPNRNEEPMDLPEPKTLGLLNEKATAKLAEIVRHYAAGEKAWAGYKSAEISAAKALLDASSETRVR